ncbi:MULTISPECIES: helix-turn-helix domain-containing protein [Desulfofundulus]|uniref:Transcriptional regulator, contains XRE-family HTH domain n=1 Tax=Desulfofundulus thermosubterraneus DSM 16057 TaxID=1121432 RepID=A0A1M6KZK6_9FIRM|nr:MULTISPECIES: helix-turn-helix transcriptional regulator [Desulfofundulus]NHM28916.1 helix-turn-helix transcriptional regulator [Desulfofundulus sp. TPOSR]SHJ64322.1 Transcriptional regulator, contains XRE-family HTH domain [Desulfofundulus thermosubterraneus DSM 16057]
MESKSTVFSQRIKFLRKQKGWTQEDLAEKLKISRSAVAGWEAPSKTNFPDKDTLLQLSNIFNVSVDYLLGRSDDPSPPPAKTEKSLQQRRIELEQAFKELLRSETVMFDGMPIGELDEEIIEDLELMLDHILEFLKKKKQKAASGRSEDGKN